MPLTSSPARRSSSARFQFSSPASLSLPVRRPMQLMVRVLVVKALAAVPLVVAEAVAAVVVAVAAVAVAPV